jgi:hypothetical protein
MSDGEFRGRVLQALEEVKRGLDRLAVKVDNLADIPWRVADLERWRQDVQHADAAQHDRHWRTRWEWTHTVVAVATALLAAAVAWAVHH